MKTCKEKEIVSFRFRKRRNEAIQQNSNEIDRDSERRRIDQARMFHHDIRR
jgi:hypothetical protein